MNQEIIRKCDRINRIGCHIAVWGMVACVLLAAIVANVTA